MKRPTQKEHLKKVLTRERNRRELTQEEVAEVVGVSVRNYQRWEQGLNYPQPYYLQQLREFFGACIDEITVSDGSPFPRGQEESDGTPFHNDQSDTQFPANDEKKYQSSTDADMSSEKIYYRRSRFLVFQRGRSFDRLALIAIVSILMISIGAGFFLHLTHPYGFGPVKPGGAWISPVGSSVGNVVHFAAFAYPTHPTDPAIAYVNFTAYWPGVDPRAWKIVCQVRIPVDTDVYSCDVDLQQLGAPPGQITISFDVYDRQGNMNMAPNGEHKIVYSPG